MTHVVKSATVLNLRINCDLDALESISSLKKKMSSRSRKRSAASSAGATINDSSIDSQSYDTSLPENWTIPRLREELKKSGVIPGPRTKKSRLVQLCSNVTSGSAAVSTSDVTAQTASQQRVVARDFPHSETSEVSVRVHPEIGNTGSSTNEIEMRKSVLSLQATVSKLTETLEQVIQRTSTTQASNNSGSLEGRNVNIRTNNIPEPDISPIVQLEVNKMLHCAYLEI